MQPDPIIFTPNRYIDTLEPHYPDTLWIRKMCLHKQSVVVARVGETHVYKKLIFYEFKTILKFKFSCIFKQ